MDILYYRCEVYEYMDVNVHFNKIGYWETLHVHSHQEMCCNPSFFSLYLYLTVEQKPFDMN